MRTVAIPALLLLAGCSGAGEGTGEEERATRDPAVLDSPAGRTGAHAPGAASAGTTMVCAEGGETIFSCQVANGKRVTVCAKPDGGAQYRFGKDRPEIVLDGGSFAQTAYSGGGEAQVQFTGKGTRYIVFSRIVRTNFTAGEPNDPAISDGVVVYDGDRLMGMQTCRGADTQPVDAALAERKLPRADELFTYETQAADTDRTAG